MNPGTVFECNIFHYQYQNLLVNRIFSLPQFGRLMVSVEIDDITIQHTLHNNLMQNKIITYKW